MCILTQLHSQTDIFYSVTVVTRVYVCDRQYNGEGSSVIILVLLYSCRLVLPLLSLYTCVCVWDHCAGSFFQNRHSLETLAPVLSQTWAWRDENTPVISSDHLNEYMRYMFILVSVICWQGCVSILCDGLTPWLVKTHWQVVPQGEAHVTEEVMCVCFFPCMSPQGCQQGGTTGPVMRGASMVQPTHWSWGKTTHP